MTSVLTKTAGQLNEYRGRFAPFGRATAVIKLVESKSDVPAWYNIRTGDATINVSHPGVNLAGADDNELAAEIMTNVPYGLYSKFDGVSAPVRRLLGLVQHELAHCRWSEWLMTPDIVRQTTKAQYAVVTLIEEIRIEKRAIDSTHGGARQTLRSSFEIVLDSVADAAPTSKADVASAWLLAVGRAYATVATHEEVRAVDDVARVVFGDEIVDTLHELLDEAVMLDIAGTLSPGYTRLIEIANEWIELVGVTSEDSAINESEELDQNEIGADTDDGVSIRNSDPGDNDSEEDTDDEKPGTGPEQDDEDKNDGPGDNADGSDDGDDEAKTGDQPSDSGGDTGTEGRGGIGDYGSVDRDDARESNKTLPPLTDDEAELLRRTLSQMARQFEKDWGVKAKATTADPRTTAAEVFTKKRRKPKFYTRAPRPEERTAATDLARRIENFNYTAPDVTKVRSLVPPGRLNTRDALRASAERKRGMLVTAKPWEGKKRRHVYNPPITIGLMTDVSGSMGWAEQTVAATSYVFSKAMTRVSGRFAAVTFGDKAEAMVWPNEILNEVRVRPANGGSEDFDHGVAALDGMLKLTTGKGVRLLVVVSDGQFVRTNEPERANVWYDRLAAAGVGIVWINGYDPRKGGVIPKNAELVQVRSGDVTGMIGPIATAMERAIATQRS